MNTIQDWITLLFGGGAFVNLFGWLAERKKRTAEIENLKTENERKEIENAERVLKYYREMVEDLAGKLKTAISELDEAKKTIKELEEKVEALTRELTKYKQLNGKAKV
ncbi:cell wall anchor protein [Ornithobacterium rhinotracheale]|uniref:cell wall anchor protein n=1 Tax=Ornithobacterium rhinotracheale TaxID=28251 RepID=UPI00129C7C34|nr:cell wall anchor protein [Ornithobacterium rhinotracheale]MRI64462.1 cell wall anchor protein [Ornithobacterium rhinotracheale]